MLADQNTNNLDKNKLEFWGTLVNQSAGQSNVTILNYSFKEKERGSFNTELLLFYCYLAPVVPAIYDGLGHDAIITFDFWSNSASPSSIISLYGNPYKIIISCVRWPWS